MNNNIAFGNSIINIIAQGDTLYCGTNNGIYYSTDGANLWMAAWSGIINQQVRGNDFVKSGDTLFVGTGETGVISTTWGNTNWSAKGSWPFYSYINNIELTGNTLCVGMFDGFYTCPLSGNVWSLNVNGINEADIRAVYADDDIMLASVGYIQGVQYSTDDGLTWQPTSLGNQTYISGFTKVGNYFYAYSSLGGLYRSADGITFTSTSIMGTGINQITCYANKLFVAAGNGLWVSNDDGLTWTQTAPGTFTGGVYAIVTKGMYLFASDGSKFLYRSDDDGDSFIAINNGAPISLNINQIAVAEPYLLTMSSTHIRRSVDDGNTFEQANLQMAGLSQCLTYGNHLFALQNKVLFSSNNYGKMWLPWLQTTPDMGYTNNIAFNKNVLLAGTLNSGIWKTELQPQLSNSYATQTLCAGNNVTLTINTTAAAGQMYYVQLSDSNGIYSNPVTIDSVFAYQDTTLQITIPSGLTAGTYKMRTIATQPYLLSVNGQNVLTVNSKPAIKVQPVSQTSCGSNGAGFYVGATGSSIQYQWQVDSLTGTFTDINNNSIYSGANNPLLLIASTATGMNGYKYRCVISGTCQPSVITNAATLQILSGITINTQPSDITICHLGSASFSVAATGAVSYQWQIRNSAGFYTDLQTNSTYSGVNTPTLSIYLANGLLNGSKYRCLLSDCYASNAATLTVNGATMMFGSSGYKTVYQGGTATFSVIAIGAGVTYQWQVDTGTGYTNIVNGGMYSGAQDSVLIITNVSISTLVFKVQCFLTLLCAPYVLVPQVGELHITGPSTTINMQPVATPGCLLQPAQIAIGASSAGASSYSWQVNNGTGWQILQNDSIYSGVNNDTLTINKTNSGMMHNNYRCWVNGCAVSDTCSLKSKAVGGGSLNITPPAFCVNQPPATLSGGLPANGYYTGNSVCNNIFYPALAGVGQHTITYFYNDSNGCLQSANQLVTTGYCTVQGIDQTAAPQPLWYPNPSAKWVTLQTAVTGKLKVYNLIGDSYYKGNYTGGTNIDVSQWPKGIYFFELRMPDKKYVSKVMVI